MGDRLATTDIRRKVGRWLLCPFMWEGKLGPHLIQCRLGRGLLPCQVASWSIQPFGHKRHRQKSGGCCAPFGGAGFSSNTMWPGWGLSPHQVASWSIQPFGRNRHGSKIGGCAPFFEGGRTGSSSKTMWPGMWSTSVPSGILIHPTVWP